MELPDSFEDSSFETWRWIQFKEQPASAASESVWENLYYFFDIMSLSYQTREA